MEVKLDKRYPVAASAEQAWAVLADIHATARCMPGAQITETLDATHFKGTVKSKVGPAVMQFGGDIELLALDAASMSMQMLGKGADKSGSSASMNLSARVEPGDAPNSCTLVGVATITVSGKLAQFGSRLLVPVSDAMLAQFADNFRAAAAAVPAAQPVAEAPAMNTIEAAGAALALAAAASSAAVVAGPRAPGVALVNSSSSSSSTASPSSIASSSPSSTASLTANTPATDGVARATAAPEPAPARLPVVQTAPVKELNALGLMWTVFKGWLAGLFGKRP